jgi:hypothetical protein
MSQAASAGWVWRKSSRCDSGQCLEVAWPQHKLVAVRDSTLPDAYLSVDHATWISLLQAVRTGKIHH